jgi:hypothetical protein
MRNALCEEILSRKNDLESAFSAIFLKSNIYRGKAEAVLKENCKIS